jgi:hypothetical protein
MMKSKAKISARISNFYCEVLIIGSGSAGLRAAIERSRRTSYYSKQKQEQ